MSQFWPKFTILTKFNDFDQISWFWPSFTILTKFHDFDQISEFWPDFRILTKFHNVDHISQLWPNFTIFSCPSSSIPTFVTHSLTDCSEFRALQTTTNQTNLTYLSDPPKLHTHLTYYPPTWPTYPSVLPTNLIYPCHPPTQITSLNPQITSLSPHITSLNRQTKIQPSWPKPN